MKPLLLGTLCAVIGLAGCVGGNHGSTVIIDGWWNIDYAKDACLGDSVCKESNASAVLAFTSEVMTQFASQSGCKGVKVFNFTSPQSVSKEVGAAIKQDDAWWLMMNFDSPAPRQSWQLSSHSPKAPLFTGNSSPQELAHRVCAILGAGGAKVQQ